MVVERRWTTISWTTSSQRPMAAKRAVYDCRRFGREEVVACKAAFRAICREGLPTGVCAARQNYLTVDESARHSGIWGHHLDLVQRDD